MTYKEYYMMFDTLDELLEETKRDIATAMIINPDRIEIIKKHSQEVIDLKFNNKNIK